MTVDQAVVDEIDLFDRHIGVDPRMLLKLSFCSW